MVYVLELAIYCPCQPLILPLSAPAAACVLGPQGPQGPQVLRWAMPSSRFIWFHLLTSVSLVAAAADMARSR